MSGDMPAGERRERCRQILTVHLPTRNWANNRHRDIDSDRERERERERERGMRAVIHWKTFSIFS